MSATPENDTNLAIGAKRRKPIKTNKVTQIQVGLKDQQVFNPLLEHFNPLLGHF